MDMVYTSRFGYQEPKQPKVKPKRGATPTKLRTKEVNLGKVHKRFLNILNRESHHLLALAGEGKLEKDDSASLANYLRLMKSLMNMDEAKDDAISDEELEKIANKTKDEPEEVS